MRNQQQQLREVKPHAQGHPAFRSRGAECSSRWVATSSPVPSVLRTGLCIRIFSSPLFPRFPSTSPFSVCSAPFRFSTRSSHLLLFRPLCPSLPLSLSPLRPHPSLSVSSSMGPSSGLWAFGGPWRQQEPCRPSLSLCPGAAAGRMGKGQRTEAAAAKTVTGAWLWLGKKGGNQELGDKGCGCQTGQRLPRSCK